MFEEGEKKRTTAESFISKILEKFTFYLVFIYIKGVRCVIRKVRVLFLFCTVNYEKNEDRRQKETDFDECTSGKCERKLRNVRRKEKKRGGNDVTVKRQQQQQQNLE